MSEVLKVIIADDEAPARKKMSRLLEDYPELELVAEAANGMEAYNAILEHDPDLVFLDIEMPGMDGLEVVGQLPEDIQPYVVFATAYNEHAIKAFELNALDYLLKPFNAERLEQTMEKVRKNAATGAQRQESNEAARKVAGDLSPQSLQRIPIPTADRFKLVDYDEVVCIEVEDRTTNIITLSKTYPINLTLEAFEKKLPQDQFLRISRSCIINLNAVQEIVLWFGNRYKIVLTNGKEAISSRERSKLLKKMLKF